MGVDRKSGAYFFSQVTPAVVLGRKLEVDAGHLAFTGFVLDAEVGQRNLSAIDL